MSKVQPRKLSPDEQLFFEKLVSNLSPEVGERLRYDVSIAEVRAQGDFLMIDLFGYDRPQYRGHRSLSHEGMMRDVHGGAVSVLVNVDQNNRLLEVEMIYWEADQPTKLEWSTLAIIAEPPLRPESAYS